MTTTTASIKANELRIGNWVLDNGIFKKVTGIKTDDIGDCVRLSGAVTNRLVKNLEPIPLTPEILEKCGFEKIDEEEYIISFATHMPSIGIRLKPVVDVWYGEMYMPGDYTHLHQLQNLYFALTNEELIVDL